MNQEKLNEIVRLHGLWLRSEEGGVRADLSKTDLSKAVLHNADLSKADLRDACLNESNLRGADLCKADLRGADLRETVLHDADLRNADLRGADLSGANLRNADLSWACLIDADLSGADLRRADLSAAIGAPPYYAVSWSGHGERGRRLSAVEHEGELWFSCGCFVGSEEKLRRYIEGEGEEEYKQSRLKALEIILELAQAEGCNDN